MSFFTKFAAKVFATGAGVITKAFGQAYKQAAASKYSLFIVYTYTCIV
jgi:hypothetical protein